MDIIDMYLYGASGHGKVIKDILKAQGRNVDGFIDDNPSLNELLGLPVYHAIGKDDEVIVSIGINAIRKKVVEKLNCKIANAAIHPSSVISESAFIDNGTVIMAGVVINADTKIGKNCIINTGATIDHECKIENYTHISPGSHLCGKVIIGEGSWVGAGSIVIPGIKIGKWCQIGAGSIVVRDIPDGYLAYGNPCRLIKHINKEMFSSR